jgi:hypothetical protein
MIYHVIEAKYVSDYIVWIRFKDGTKGEIDFRNELDGPVFEPLKDLEFFKRFKVHPELHTLVWDNGADFAPEFLYEKFRVTA